MVLDLYSLHPLTLSFVMVVATVVGSAGGYQRLSNTRYCYSLASSAKVLVLPHHSLGHPLGSSLPRSSSSSLSSASSYNSLGGQLMCARRAALELHIHFRPTLSSVRRVPSSSYQRSVRRPMVFRQALSIFPMWFDSHHVDCGGCRLHRLFVN